MVDHEEPVRPTAGAHTLPTGIVVAAVAVVAALAVVITSSLSDPSGTTSDDIGRADGSRASGPPATVTGATRWNDPFPSTPSPDPAAEAATNAPPVVPLPATITVPVVPPPTAAPAPSTSAPKVSPSSPSPPSTAAPSPSVPYGAAEAFPDESPPPPAGTISAWLEAPDTIVSGSTATATVIVHNGSGRPLVFGACDGPYAVELRGEDYVQHPARTQCLMMFRLPTGTSRWPVKLSASYDMCVPAPAPPGVALCRTDATGSQAIPGLPPGGYVAVATAGGWFPNTPPVPITVLASS